MKNVVGIYHGDCLDGTTAAAVLLKKFPGATLHPLTRMYTPEEAALVIEKLDQETEVYMVDFSLHEAGMEKMVEKVAKITVIDHHIGAKEMFESLVEKHGGNFEFVFDNSRSGASLSWVYFFGKETMPRIVALVEEIDLFKWKPGTHAKALGAYGIFLINKPEEVLKYFDAPIESILKKGESIHEFLQLLTGEYVEHAEATVLQIGGYKIRSYNVPAIIRSEFGHRLSLRWKEAVAIFTVIKGNTVRLNFRSDDECSPTALEFAKMLGGGGHKNAAGANVPLKKFCEMIVYENHDSHST